MLDFESTNLDSESNEICLLNKYEYLNNHHSGDDDYVDVCNDEFPSEPANPSLPREYFYLKYLDLESDSVNEYVVMKTSSLSHYPLCSTIFYVSTYEEDTPCYLSSSFDELTSQLTQGSEVIHTEQENNQIIEYSFHPSSSPVFHDDSSSNQIFH